MGKKLRTPVWSRVLVAMGCLGIFLETGVLAYEQPAPPIPPPPASKDAQAPAAVPPNQTSFLAGDQATAFHSGYLRQQEQVTGKVLRGREDKQLFGQGDSLYLKMGLNADVRTGDLLTLYRPTRQVYHPASREPLGRIIAI